MVKHRKRTVEETLNISINEIVKIMKMQGTSSGTFTWTLNDFEDALLRWSFRFRDTGPWLDFSFRYDTQPIIKQRIQLLLTNTNYGGQRLWFQCPAMVQGDPCRKRVAKLYFPPHAKLMACRHCYCLTYRSCQETRFPKRLVKDLAEFWGVTPELAREIAEEVC